MYFKGPNSPANSAFDSFSNFCSDKTAIVESKVLILLDNFSSSLRAYSSCFSYAFLFAEDVVVRIFPCLSLYVWLLFPNAERS